MLTKCTKNYDKDGRDEDWIAQVEQYGQCKVDKK